jgi:hypothetical protein
MVINSFNTGTTFTFQLSLVKNKKLWSQPVSRMRNDERRKNIAPSWLVFVQNKTG